MAREFREVDAWLRIDGKDYCLIVGGEVDQGVPEVDGPVAFTVHVHANSTHEELGTFDGFGQGSVVGWAPDLPALPDAHAYRFAVAVPVANAIANERRFDAWVYDVHKYGPFVGDRSIASNAMSFAASEGQDPPQFEPAGTRWGTAYSPPR